MAKEGERGKFQKVEWKKRCEKDWRFAIAMGHGWWISPLGLYTMSSQTIIFSILMDFSFLLSVKIMRSLGDGFSLGQPLTPN
jgi:hypothetical protein